MLDRRNIEMINLKSNLFNLNINLSNTFPASFWSFVLHFQVHLASFSISDKWKLWTFETNENQFFTVISHKKCPDRSFQSFTRETTIKNSISFFSRNSFERLICFLTPEQAYLHQLKCFSFIRSLKRHTSTIHEWTKEERFWVISHHLKTLGGCARRCFVDAISLRNNYKERL